MWISNETKTTQSRRWTLDSYSDCLIPEPQLVCYSAFLQHKIKGGEEETGKVLGSAERSNPVLLQC